MLPIDMIDRGRPSIYFVRILLITYVITGFGLPGIASAQSNLYVILSSYFHNKTPFVKILNVNLTTDKLVKCALYTEERFSLDRKCRLS